VTLTSGQFTVEGPFLDQSDSLDESKNRDAREITVFLAGGNTAKVGGEITLHSPRSDGMSKMRPQS
jgi:hypothetical protein